MDDKEFNYYRLCLMEKQVSRSALQNVFELLWNKNNPSRHWNKDGQSVKMFEAQAKVENKKVKLPTDLGGLWKNYEWDTSKFAFALVDSKLFQLEVNATDDKVKPVSEHIGDIRKIRNKIAHHTSCACGDEEFACLTDALAENLKALRFLQLGDFEVSVHVEKLEYIKSLLKPVAKDVFKESFRFFALCKKLKDDKDNFLLRYASLDKEKRFLIETIHTLSGKEDMPLETVEKEENAQLENDSDVLKKRYSYKTKYENLKYDYDHLINVKNDVEYEETVETEKMALEIDYLENLIEDTYRKHSIEIDRLESENAILKQNLTHSADLSSLKLKLQDKEKTLSDMQHKFEHMQKQNSKMLEELRCKNLDLREMIERLMDENYERRQGLKTININIHQVLICYHVLIFAAMTYLQAIKVQATK